MVKKVIAMDASQDVRSEIDADLPPAEIGTSEIIVKSSYKMRKEAQAVADWDRVVFLFLGRGKTLKTTHARLRVDTLIRTGRHVIAVDLEPINAGLASAFAPGIVRTPGYAIDNGRDLAAYLYPIVEEIGKKGGVGVVDTPGNDRSLVEMADLYDITELMHAYGVRLVLVVTCGAEADDVALLDRLAAVLKRAPDCLILAVNQKGLPSHFKDHKVLKKHLGELPSVSKLMSGPSAVRFVPMCDAIEKLDGKLFDLHKVAELPLTRDNPLSIFEAGFLNTFLKRYDASFKGLLT